MLVQVTTETLEALRVPRGSEPVYELDLGPHQRIVSVLHTWRDDAASRKTVDHYMRVVIESRLYSDQPADYADVDTLLDLEDAHGHTLDLRDRMRELLAGGPA